MIYRTARAWRQAQAEWIPPGYEVDGIPVQSLTYQNRVPSRWCRPRDAQSRIAVALTALLQSRGVRPEHDLLLSQFALPYGPAVQRAARALGLRFAVYLRGDDVWRDPHSDGARRMSSFVDVVRNADLLIAVARSLVSETERLARVPLRAAVVPNGIDLETFRPARSIDEPVLLRRRLRIGPDESVVVCVADLLIRKGWRELIDVVARVAASGRAVTLAAVAGNRRDEVDLPRELAQRAPAVRLILLRDLESSQVADVYRAADAFCLLSHREGIANALLEAMATGLPVVTSDVQGHLEAVTDGIDGRIVPVRNAEAAAAALTSLLESSDLRLRLGRAARRRAEAIGTSAAAAARLSQVLLALQQGRLRHQPLDLDPYSAAARPA